MPSRILRLWNPDASAWEEVGDSRLSVHLAAADPHPAYATDADLTAHAGAADPHPQYLTAAEGTGAFLPLTGGTLSGALVLQGATATTNVLQAKLAADTQPRFRADASGRLEWGVGGASAPDVSLAKSSTTLLASPDLRATGSVTSGSFFQATTSGVPTTGGVRLPSGTGGNVAWRNFLNTGNLTLGVDSSDRLVASTDFLVNEATPTVSLKQTADTEPRSRLTDTALSFGPGGTTAPDATLARSGAGALRVDGHLGVAVAPQTNSSRPAVRVGQAGSFSSDAAAANAIFTSNSYYLAPNNVAITTGAASFVALSAGALQVWTAPSATAGANLTYTQRVNVAQTGTLSVTADAGQASLASGPWTLRTHAGDPAALEVTATGRVFVEPAGNAFLPSRDNGVGCGAASNRWTTVYAVAGTINTSSREAKEGITPLDPALALEAVRSTPAVTFTYTAPERPPEWYDLPDDPEQAEQVLQQRLTAAPLEAAARQQAGFVAEDAHSLFLVGEGQTAASNTCGVLLAALQYEATAREALETRVAALEGA